MKKYLALALIAPLLVSCSSSNKKGAEYNEAWVKDTNGFDILMGQFAHNIALLPLGIMAGLFIGKPLGISLFCWLALKLKWASLPEGTTCKQIMAVGILCGMALRCRFSSPPWPLAAWIPR